VEVANDGSALDDVVGGKIFEGKRAPPLRRSATNSWAIMPRKNLLDVWRCGGVCGQFGLTEYLALFVELPLRWKMRWIRKASQVGIAKFTGFFSSELKAAIR